MEELLYYLVEYKSFTIHEVSAIALNVVLNVVGK